MDGQKPQGKTLAPLLQQTYTNPFLKEKTLKVNSHSVTHHINKSKERLNRLPVYPHFAILANTKMKRKKNPSTQIRTEDPLIYSQMLYQLSYGRLISYAFLMGRLPHLLGRFHRF